MSAIRIVCIFIFDTPAVSDFAVILDAAENLLNNVNVMNEYSYFKSYAYQTGPVLYTYFLLKIWDSVYFLKIINCLFSALNCVLIYYTVKKIASERSAKIVSLAYGLLPFSLLYNTVLSNQIPGSTFFYLGILVFINNKNHRIRNYIFCALLFGIGNFLRSEGIIFAAAILGLYLINIITDKKKRKCKLLHIGTILFIITYFLFGFLSSNIVKITGLNNGGLKNNYTEWKFLVGLNTEYCGTYNLQDLVYMETKEKAKNEIKNRITSLTPRSAFELFSCKAKTTWNGGTLAWIFSDLEDKNYNILGLNFNKADLQEILSSLNKLIYYTALALLIIGLYNKVKENKINNIIILFANILILNLIVYSLIEIQSRYIYLVQISIFILASLGVDYLLERKEKVK